MDAARIRSIRMVAAASLKKGGAHPTGAVGRVLARGRGFRAFAERHRSLSAIHPSQHALCGSSIVWTRIGVWTDHAVSRGLTDRVARLKGNLPSGGVSRTIRTGTTYGNPMEPQFLLPSAGWQGAPDAMRRVWEPHFALGDPNPGRKSATRPAWVWLLRLNGWLRGGIRLARPRES